MSNLRSSLLNRRPSPVTLSSESIVTKSHLNDTVLPVVLTPTRSGVDLCKWAAANTSVISQELAISGAILFRGFANTNETFLELLRITGGEPLSYNERSSPRKLVGENIYTSTEHPPDQEIFLHNEQSYNTTFPTKIYFGCVSKPTSKGATPLADCRRVMARLRAHVVDRLRGEYLYVRNFGGGMGLTWQEAFQTSEPAVVEEYCRSRAIEWLWRDGDRLQTRQRRKLIARHPRTGELVWFNHFTFFNIETLPALVRDAIERECGDDYPNNTYDRDGKEVEQTVLAELHQAYVDETVRFAWENGDILLVDNMLVAHGRESFSGPRRVIAGMADPCRWDDVAV